MEIDNYSCFNVESRTQSVNLSENNLLKIIILK